MTEQNTFDIAELQQKANDGDAQAQFDLALCYVEGKGVEKNGELAFEWHNKAAEQGHLNAQFALGLYYFLRIVERQTNTLISKWVNEKYVHKSIDPAFDLAVSQALYTKPTGVNDELAFVWLKNAAEQNHAEANYWLGICYRDGIGSQNNEELAFDCFSISAENGLSAAQNVLAYCYFDGKGVQENIELGWYWCEVAANNGFAEAQYKLACRYLDGGVDKNTYLGFTLLKQAAEQGFDDAEIRLADCYAKGFAVEKCDEQAFAWHTKAANKEHAESQYWLAWYYLRGGILEQLEEIDAQILENGPSEYWRNVYLDKGYERAFEWAQKAAEEDYTDACLLLGFMNLYGIGTDQNTDSAFELFKNAAVQDQRGVAAYFLQDLYTTEKNTSPWNDKLDSLFSEQANPLAVLQFFDIEELMNNLDEKRQNNLLHLKVELLLKSGNFDAAKDIAQKNSEIVNRELCKPI
jgi:TPR repeat protein